MAGEITVNLKPLADLASFLSSRFVARDREIIACLAGLVSGEPVFLCGPPGTAKTDIVEEMSRRVNARYFYFPLHKHTDPDEMLGPINIVALREGRLERVTTGRLPDAEIVFIDEIFKGGSAVREVLLDIILNKRFMNGTQYIRLPMLALYSASNEVSTDSDDQAFYDRLLIRAFLDYIPDSELDELLLRGAELTFGDGASIAAPQLSIEYVKQLQAFARARALLIARDGGWRQKIIDALLELKSKGIILSDRRKVKLLLVLSAVSTVFAEQEPTLDSLADALRFTAVHTEDDVAKVEEVIIKLNLSSIDLTQYNTVIEETLKIVGDVQRALSAGTLNVNQLTVLRESRKQLVKLYNAIPTSLRTYNVKCRIKSAVDEIDRIIKMITG